MLQEIIKIRTIFSSSMTALPTDVYLGNTFVGANGIMESGSLSLVDLTPGDAVATDIAANKIAIVNGERVTGTVPVHATLNITLSCGQSHNIPYGIYPTGSKIIAQPLSSQTAGNVTADKILSGYSIWSNGVLINGTMTVQSTVAY